MTSFRPPFEFTRRTAISSLVFPALRGCIQNAIDIESVIQEAERTAGPIRTDSIVARGVQIHRESWDKDLSLAAAIGRATAEYKKSVKDPRKHADT